MKINPTFQNYYYVKILWKSKVNPKGNYATFRLVDSAESKSEIMENFITKEDNQSVDTKKSFDSKFN
jgi:hypothetical protein